MRNLIIVLFTVISVYAGAQDVRLHEIHATRPLRVVKPVELDSVDAKGRKPDCESLLKLKLNVPEHQSFSLDCAADTTGFFILQSDDSAYIQLFDFYAEADCYGKAKIKVSSTDLFEIYIDDKLTASKTTVEDSISKAASATAEFSPYPATNRVVIKLLHTGKSREPALKVDVENRQDGRTISLTDRPLRRMTLDDAIKGRRVVGASVSPSGKYVLLSYSTSYGARSTSSTELYTVASRKRVIIDLERQKQQLGWMPCSDLLYYVEKDGDRSNIININPETLVESRFATDVPNEYFSFSPDEKALFYSKSDRAPASSDKDLFIMHTLTNRTGGKPSISFLYRYDLTAGLTQQLTFGSKSTRLNDVSADGKHILFSTSEETVTVRPFHKSALYLMNLETMQIETLYEDERFASHAVFSPDGNTLLIIGAPEAFDGVGLNISEGQTANSYDAQAFLMDIKTKAVEPITKDFDPSVKSAVWSEHDGLIYLHTADGDRSTIYTYNIRTRKFTVLPSEEDVIEGFRLAVKGDVISYNGVSLSNSTRAYIYNIRTRKTALIADPYAEHLAELKLGEVHDFNFTNSAGTEIEGYYFLPPDFDPTKRYPLIVNYYGGTTPTERVFESRYPKHVYAALGYVVYVLQPSGATGYGQKFSALHVNTWGKRSSEDIIEGTEKFVAAHPFVDAKKIGCIGASYGGFMTMYLQTRTDLFAAAVSHAGISSISSYWGEGYWGYAYSSAASANSYPWNNIDLYINQSPLYSADKINTPLLLLHGSSDTNVPVGESIQMYTALKILGKTVELVQVKGEDHHILTYEKRLQWNNTIFAWFDRWLKDRPEWWNGQWNSER
jgi:dipeptidyl aminopeptidase/acylaminoacyl peptidase